MIKFKAARLYFLCGVVVAVAVRVLLKLPNERGGKLLSGPDRVTFVMRHYLLFFPSLTFGSQILEAP